MTRRLFASILAAPIFRRFRKRPSLADSVSDITKGMAAINVHDFRLPYAEASGRPICHGAQYGMVYWQMPAGWKPEGLERSNS